MLLFDEVLKFAGQYGLPINNQRVVLTEYLQCEILDSLFESSPNLHFIGGTSLRLLHNLPRFSEDLDFDNFDLKKEDFKVLIDKLNNNLALKGFNTEFRLTFKGAYHCYFKFNELLYDNKLSPYREEKILVRLDTTNQAIKVKREFRLLNRYGLVREIMTNPIETIMAQKILALLNRKTAKGRDFYDFIFLQAKTEPDFDYLNQVAGLKDWQDIRKQANIKFKSLDFKRLALDVEKFLFNRRDIDKVENFEKYFNQIVDAKIVKG